MESKPTFVMPPVETYTPLDKSEEVVCDNKPNENLLGAVRVGGKIGADCFVPWDEKKPYITYEIDDND